MVGEFGDDRVHALAGQFHLVQGLDGGETRHRAGAPLTTGQLRLGTLLFGLGELFENGLEAGGFGHAPSPTRSRLRKAMRSRQARAAPPPRPVSATPG